MWRLIFAVILFLLSLLTLFRAPTNFFWRVAVAVTEFPYLFIATSSILFVFCLRALSSQYSSIIISGLSLALFSTSVIRAYARGNNLGQNLSRIFPSTETSTQLPQPFSFFKMFSGIGIKMVIPQVFAYKTLLERTLNIDFYPSANATSKSPCIVVIHGGSWAGGDSKQLPALNSYLANRGYNVAAINYRLAPKYKFPAPIEDTKEALNYLIKNSVKLNIDTTNFVILGRSAGAQIALMAAYTFKNPHIKGVISFYGPADMAWGARIKSNKLVLNTDKVFTDYLGGLIDQIPGKYKEATSTEFIGKNSTPTLIIHGQLDPMVSFEHSNRLNRKLEKENVRHYFLDLPWATHGCDYNINGPSGQLTTFAAERFINSVTRE